MVLPGWLLVAIGLVVGTAGTLIGAGGGFVLVPLLAVLEPQRPPAILTAITLSVVFANALSGSIAYARQRRVDVRSGLIFAAAGLPGAIGGAFLSHHIDRRTFDPLLGSVLVIGAIAVLVRPSSHATAEVTSGTRTLVERDGTVHHYTPRVALGALISTGVGLLSSLLGIGGGIIHVPAMVLALGFPTHIATATSHFVLAILALAAVLVHAGTGTIAPGLREIVPLAIGVVLGAPAGAWLSSRLHGRWILVGLALALASVGLRLLIHR
jgi:uncharacterized membrane protein YfcA